MKSILPNAIVVTLFQSAFLGSTSSFKYDPTIGSSRFNAFCQLARSSSFDYNSRYRRAPGRRLTLNMMDSEEDPWETERLERRNIPSTSFGAEAVPEEQRPANEYLDLIQQPLFGWANQDSGDVGLATRLLVTYLAFFALV